MRRATSIALSALVSGAFVLGSLTTPAYAGDVVDPDPQLTQEPTATATPTAAPAPTKAATRAVSGAAGTGYQDVTGFVTELADSPVDSSVKVLDVPDLGYLSIDFSAVTLGADSSKQITVRVAVPTNAPVGPDGRVAFAALSSVTSPLVASQIVASSLDSIGVDAMVNQTPTVAATHQVYAVAVTPANVCGATCSVTSSQSPANIRADVQAANTYWLSQSDGNVGFELVGTTAWYRSAYSCNVSTPTNFVNLLNEARAKATAQIGYVNTSNAHIALFFPSGSYCGTAIGLGTGGFSANSGGGLWVVGSGHSGVTEFPDEYQTLAHELGHNLSLGHSDWLDCSSATPSPGVYGTVGCTLNEYGAAADVMGSGDGDNRPGSLSSAHAIRSGMWAPSAYVNAPRGSSSYTLKPLSSAAGLRSVVIEGNNGVNYFVEFRDTAGIDAPYASLACPFAVGLCAASTAGVQITRLEQPLYDLGGGYSYEFKGFPGDHAQVIGRTVSGVKRVNYVAGESITLDGVTVSVTSIDGSGAHVSIQRNEFGALVGSVFIQPTAGSGSQWPWYAGDTLTAMIGHVSDYETVWKADSFTYQWYRNGDVISGATSQSYMLGIADIGQYIGVRANSTGVVGYSVSDPDLDYYYGYGPIAPGIIKGTVSIDASTLPMTAVLDGFSGGASYTYQWRRNGASIVGATTSKYTPTALDANAYLSVKVSAAKYGSKTVTAVSVSKDYTLTAAGTLGITGTAQVGKVLEAVNSLSYTTVDGPVSATTAYQWYRNGVAISGATGDEYALVAVDLSALITVKALATASGYASNTTTSPATTRVVRGDILGSYEVPLVSQTPGTLQLSVALPVGSITDSVNPPVYSWFRDDVVIAGAGAATYTLTAADYGKAIKARVVLTKPNYNSVALTSAAAAYSVLSSGSTAITGTVRVGEVLTAPELAYSTWEGGASTTRSFQWFRSGVVIAGATGGTYTPVAIDFGAKLTVRVTASLSEFLPSVVLSPATVPVAKGVLLGTHAVPVVDKSGTLLLTASPADGSFTDVVQPTPAYQWFRGGVAVAGATLPTFQLTAADYNKAIFVRLTASKPNYTSVVVSSVPVNYSLVPDLAVPVFTGDVFLGGALTVQNRVFSVEGVEVTADGVAYQWLRDGLPIALNAASNVYNLVAADLGKTISVRVTATYAGALQSVSTSAGTQKVGTSLLTGAGGAVTVSQSGLVLTAHPGVTEAGAVHAKQWYRNGVAIYLATGLSYTLTAADFGKVISVRVVSAKAGFTTVVGSSQPVNYSVTPSGPLAVSGTAQVGQVLTPVLPTYSSYEGVVSPSFAVQWLRNGAAIPGATGSTYTLAAADVTAKISVRVSASLVGALTSTLTSPMTAPVVKGTFAGDRALPTVALNSGTMTLTASLTDGSVGDPVPAVAYQWLRDGVAVPYSTLPTYQLTAADYNKGISVRLVSSKAGYTAVTLTSLPVNYALLPSTSVPAFTGPPELGDTLTAVDRTFTAGGGSVTPDLVAYQWLRDGVPIVGATASSYSPAGPADLGKAISLRVTATYAGFLPSVSTSAATQKLAENAFDGYWNLPTVSKTGLVLTAVPGIVSALPPAPTYARQWYRNGAAIYLATGATYTLTAADYGKSISVKVTATKATFTPVVATSLPVNYSVTPSGALAAPTGTARVGMLLTASTVSYTTSEGAVSPTLSYQWLHNGLVIPGATGATYTAVASDYGTKLQVRVTAALAGFLPSTTVSAATVVVAKGVLTGTMAAPTVTSNPVTFKLSVALTGGSIDQTGLAQTNQWYRNGVPIYLATGTSYQLTAADYGKDIRVKVTIAKTNYTTVVLYSAVIVP